MFILKLFKRNKSCINHVSVIGSGIMGSGIAQSIASSGFPCNIIGLDINLLKESQNNIKVSLERAARKKFNDSEQCFEYVNNTMSKIAFITDLKKVIESDLVIEAVTEKIGMKKEIAKKLDEIIDKSDKNIILTTNTSSLSVSDIFSDIISNRIQYAGLHFFNPVPIMGLVEIVETEKTAGTTIQLLEYFARKTNKVPIKCKDVPGFIVNQLLLPYLKESIDILERGDASAETIDQAMKLGAGYKMGPFELCDYIGLDTLKFILDGWFKRFPSNENFKCPKLLSDMVKQGKLGKKSGNGFYLYKQ